MNNQFQPFNQTNRNSISSNLSPNNPYEQQAKIYHLADTFVSYSPLNGQAVLSGKLINGLGQVQDVSIFVEDVLNATNHLHIASDNQEKQPQINDSQRTKAANSVDLTDIQTFIQTQIQSTLAAILPPQVPDYSAQNSVTEQSRLFEGNQHLRDEAHSAQNRTKASSETHQHQRITSQFEKEQQINPFQEKPDRVPQSNQLLTDEDLTDDLDDDPTKDISLPVSEGTEPVQNQKMASETHVPLKKSRQLRVKERQRLQEKESTEFESPDLGSTEQTDNTSHSNDGIAHMTVSASDESDPTEGLDLPQMPLNRPIVAAPQAAETIAAISSAKNKTPDQRRREAEGLLEANERHTRETNYDGTNY